MNEQLHNT